MSIKGLIASVFCAICIALAVGAAVIYFEMESSNSSSGSSATQGGVTTDVNQTVRVFDTESQAPNDVSSDQSLFDEGLEFAEQLRLNDAFSRVHKAYLQSPSDVRYRQTLLVLQKLSSVDFRLKKLKTLWGSGSGRSDVSPLIGVANRLLHNAKGVVIEQRPSKRKRVLEVVKEYQLKQIQLLAKEIKEEDIVLGYVDQAKSAFGRQEYANELKSWEMAIAHGWPNKNDYTNCQSFYTAVIADRLGRLNEALEHLKTIDRTDRHWQIKEELTAMIGIKIKEQHFRTEAETIWKQCDWDKIKTFCEQIDPPTSKRNQALVEKSIEILGQYSVYSKSRYDDYTRQAELNKELQVSLETARQENPCFDSALKWTNKERERLYPYIQEEFQRLCRDAKSNWKEYSKSKITVQEIKGWDTDTNFNPIMVRVHTLKRAYVAVDKAQELTKAVLEDRISIEVSLEKMKSYISDISPDEMKLHIYTISEESHNRAYVIRNEHYDTNSVVFVGKLCTVAAALPPTSNKNYPEKARLLINNLPSTD